MQGNFKLRGGKPELRKARPAVVLAPPPALSQQRLARLRVLPEPAQTFNALLPSEERDVSQLIFEGKHWAAAFVTQPNEYDYDITEIEGEVPPAIRGTLFRNGPGNFERGGQAYEHMLDGDGYICSFKFQCDKVSFHSRYVRTSEFEMEEKAGQVLFRNTFGTQRQGSQTPDTWIASSVLQPALQGLQEAVDDSREQVQAAANSPMVDGQMQLSGTFPGQVQPVRGTSILGGIIKQIAKTIDPVVQSLQETVLPVMQQAVANAASMSANAMDMKLKNPVNTNVVVWGGRLLALWEAGSPCELDPATLATTGEQLTLGGFVQPGMAPSSTGWAALDKRAGLGSALTAHPHVEPATAEHGPRMVIWNWRSIRGQDLVINIAEYDEQWQQQGGASLKMRDSMFNPHDFAFTPRHHVFFQNAMSMDMASYILGLKGPAQCVEVLPEQPMQVHVVPRNGGPAQVLTAESSFLIHHANAFEDGEDIVVWSSGWAPSALQALKRGQGMLGSWKTVLKGDFGGIPFTSMLEHRINTRTGQVKRKVLFDLQNADHPRVNSSFYSKPTRYMFFNGSNGPDRCSNPPQAFMRLDTHTGESQSWAPGSQCFCEELIFVPGPNGAADELDGHLLGMIYDGQRHQSSLAIMDARDFSKGPVCRLWLQHHVPHGLHGFFTEQQF